MKTLNNFWVYFLFIFTFIIIRFGYDDEEFSYVEASVYEIKVDSCDVLWSMQFIIKADTSLFQILKIEFDTPDDSSKIAEWFDDLVPTKVYVDTNYIEIIYIGNQGVFGNPKEKGQLWINSNGC